MKKDGGIGRVAAGGLAGGVVASLAVVVWVVAVFWNWSFIFSSTPGPGQKVFLYFVAPIMLGAATVPVSAGLGAGWRRVSGMFAFVSAAACFVCVASVEEWMSFPWPGVAAALFALPGVSAFVAVFGRGGVERLAPVFAGMLGMGVVVGMAVVLTWGFAEGVWFHAALFVASWVVFPAVAAAMAERGIGGGG